MGVTGQILAARARALEENHLPIIPAVVFGGSRIVVIQSVPIYISPPPFYISHKKNIGFAGNSSIILLP